MFKLAYVLKNFIDSHRIVRYVGSFETPTKYTLIGIWAFSEKGIDRKIRSLRNMQIYDDGVIPLYKVDEFPDYVTWRY